MKSISLFRYKITRKETIDEDFFAETNVLKEAFQPNFVRDLWNLPEREFQYAALDYIERSLKITENYFSKQLKKVLQHSNLLLTI
ncbi:hypothetical protein GW534_05050 [Bacillus sp. P1(2020)]|uniref:Uncharacterized protein n=1 Tax=Pallidibacillus pasinlerensis TaxID=2703818 RepID=A0ABX0A6T2_9BACI|nr:hypothetical protein [Pallidibacillus pasinlerensis]